MSDDAADDLMLAIKLEVKKSIAVARVLITVAHRLHRWKAGAIARLRRFTKCVDNNGRGELSAPRHR